MGMVKNGYYNMEPQEIIEPDEESLQIVKAYKHDGKTEKDFFPLMTYDMIQSGYPRPNKGVMRARAWGGTDENGILLSPNGMWCKTEDVKKMLLELKPYVTGMKEYD